jgi:hypothetical protein
VSIAPAAAEGDRSGWQLQQTVNKVLKAVSFADPMNGYAAAELGGVYRTTDGGDSWTLDLDTGAEMSAIDAQTVSPDSIDVWCVGFLPNFTGVIYKERIALVALFADGFESGDTSAWSATVP